MFYLILSLIILGVVTMIVGYFRNRRLHKQLEDGKISELPSIKQVQDMECCGQHEVCERDSLLAAVSKEIEYYDDEELDRFQGYAAEDYSEAEEDEFREILYTMKESDVPGWVRSLQLRAVELPSGIRDEVVMIVNELRQR